MAQLAEYVPAGPCDWVCHDSGLDITEKEKFSVRDPPHQLAGAPGFLRAPACDINLFPCRFGRLTLQISVCVAL